MKDLHKIEKSAIFTVVGIILLFSTAIIVTLIAPGYVDPTWIQPSSAYQVQMYEIHDPNLYISSLKSGSTELQSVYYIKEDLTIKSFLSERPNCIAFASMKIYSKQCHHL